MYVFDSALWSTVQENSSFHFHMKHDPLNKTRTVHRPVEMTKDERETPHRVDLSRDFCVIMLQQQDKADSSDDTCCPQSQGQSEKERSTHCLKAAMVFSRFSPAPATEE